MRHSIASCSEFGIVVKETPVDELEEGQLIIAPSNDGAQSAVIEKINDIVRHDADIARDEAVIFFEGDDEPHTACIHDTVLVVQP